jgi:3,4-dihydroxy 2-butanone 4-phosphate synthase/GTP cyclohydrolase II
MKLSEYLAAEQIKAAEFSRRTGISEATISLLSRGETWLSKDMAQRILVATDGKVTPTDFLSSSRTEAAE